MILKYAMVCLQLPLMYESVKWYSPFLWQHRLEQMVLFYETQENILGILKGEYVRTVAILSVLSHKQFKHTHTHTHTTISHILLNVLTYNKFTPFIYLGKMLHRKLEG